jgi:hypothetical protein
LTAIFPMDSDLLLTDKIWSNNNSWQMDVLCQSEKSRVT